MRILFQKRGGGLFGLVIRLWTHSDYCHCELEFEDGRRVTSSPFRGVCQNPALTATGASRWDALDLPEITADQEQQVRAFFEQELGSGYDWKGLLLSRVVRAGVQSNSRWFCSEFCAAALTHIGYLQVDRPARLSPEKLYRLLLARQA